MYSTEEYNVIIVEAAMANEMPSFYTLDFLCLYSTL